MGKEMICPLCRYLHKDQPFMTLEADMDHKLSTSNRRSQQQPHHRALNAQDTLSSHEHPTSGTVLSMMPSFTETFLGPQAGTIQSSGICLKTSTWLLLYALPFTVAVAFLGFVLGQVETLWSKISCMIGSAICYMACWALVVAVMDPDHESRTILMSMESAHAHTRDDDNSGDDPLVSTNMLFPFMASPPSSSSSTPSLLSLSRWTNNRYAQELQNRVMDLAEILDEFPDTIGEW
ncbi:hypothetical protein BGZ81_009663 [Podila clonocystis]|nr:hypothetical protein BGZ81_009663 [Podila clonocystis]